MERLNYKEQIKLIIDGFKDCSNLDGIEVFEIFSGESIPLSEFIKKHKDEFNE